MVTKMDEYIKRKAVKELINIDHGGYLAAIDCIPAADVAPVIHAHWAKYLAYLTELLMAV